MNTLVIAIVYIALPLFLIARLWKNQSASYLSWLSWLATASLFVWYIFSIGVWPLTPVGYYFRYLLLASLAVAAIKSYFNVKREFVPIGFKNGISLGLNGVVWAFPAWLIVSTFASHFQVPEGVELDFPLKSGSYYIAHGGNNIVTNHHFDVDAQKYAMDIVKLNSFGFRSNALNPTVLENYNILGDTLYSPCKGKIIELVDDFMDQEPGLMDEEHPAGNFLAIEMEGSASTVVLAHILKGSFLVKKGDAVDCGQPLAKVGNSGNTSEPHLHIHAVKSRSGDLLFTGEGVPIRFNGRFLVRNDIVH